MEHSHAGLFDVSQPIDRSRMTKVPGLSALAPILNQAPTGLTMMTQAIAAQFPAYLQQHVQDALAKFLSPTIAGVGSIIGGQDGVIAALEAQITGLLSANPVVAAVDGLVAELAALNTSAHAGRGRPDGPGDPGSDRPAPRPPTPSSGRWRSCARSSPGWCRPPVTG